MRARGLFGLYVAGILSAGCTIGRLAASGDPADAGGAVQAQQNRAVITRADIERIHAASALDAVQRYRSDLLTARGQSSILLSKQTYPVVFIDNQAYGQIDELRNIAADGIQEIRCYTGSDAVRLFGAQYGGGVIQIVSRGG